MEKNYQHCRSVWSGREDLFNLIRSKKAGDHPTRIAKWDEEVALRFPRGRSRPESEQGRAATPARPEFIRGLFRAGGCASGGALFYTRGTPGHSRRSHRAAPEGPAATHQNSIWAASSLPMLCALPACRRFKRHLLPSRIPPCPRPRGRLRGGLRHRRRTL